MIREFDGCTPKQVRELREIGRRVISAGGRPCRIPIEAFLQNQRNAAWRGIGWSLTLWEWWTIWQKSGKWEQRGDGRGQYVMCRKGDVGPYALGNVFIASAQDNIAQTSKSGLPRGVSRVGNRFSANIRKDGARLYLGCFGTRAEASAAYSRALEELNSQRNSWGNP